jgi:hypothetical protein
MSFGKKVLEFLTQVAEAQTSANAGRVGGRWRAIASGVVCEVRSNEDSIAIALWRSDGVVLCVAVGTLIVNMAELHLIDAAGNPCDHSQGHLTIIGGGASLEVELYHPRCRFRDSFVR